jgi:segregation and condensation protein B
MENLKAIIESLVFVSETPLSVDRLQSILETVDRRDIRLALTELQGDYEDRQSGFRLQEVAGGFQFRTHAAHSDWIKKLLKPSPTRLSRAALETLAIIAYKQPIIRADVEHIRGVDSGGVLRMLLERKFIRVLGRKDIPGRPMIYGTTKAFLEIFNLKDLSALPSPKEITSLGIADADEDRGQIDETQKLAAISKDTASAANVADATTSSTEATTGYHPTDYSTDSPITQDEPNDQTYAGSGGGHLPVSGMEGENEKVSHDETHATASKSDDDHATADREG